MDIRFDRSGPLGVVTLDRPKALNALTYDMVAALDRRLAEWAGDPGVRAVLVESASPRAFCAGGDIRALAEAGRRGEPLTREFYRLEYRLNHRIKTYAKPYIALIDGVVMGGGVGISIHGSHRVVTERCQFAMPETGIGFFPDVGGSWFLPRSPDGLGIYLGLTGARLGAADLRHCNLATHHLPSHRLAEVVPALAAATWSGDGHAVVSQTLYQLAQSAGLPPLAARQAVIDRCFGADSVEEILARLAVERSDWAQETATTLSRKSPTSLKVTLRQLRLGAGLADFAAAMAMEYRLSQRFVAGHDFYEGLRAVIIDKDQAPRWQPATLAEVDDATVDAYFAPLPEGDLDFPNASR
jgi:enoyl-CoA hydratase